MAAYQCGQNIYYRSFRDIAMGEELLVWYSDSYQKHLEIPLSLKETDQVKIEGKNLFEQFPLQALRPFILIIFILVERAGSFIEKGTTVSIAVATSQGRLTSTPSQNMNLVSSTPQHPRPTTISRGYPEYHTAVAQKPSFIQTENVSLPHSSKPVTSTGQQTVANPQPLTSSVQQVLADQIKKRIEKETCVLDQEPPNKQEMTGEIYVLNEVPSVTTSHFQDQFKTSDFQDPVKSSDIHRHEHIGFKSPVQNDLSLPFKCRQCQKVFTQRIQLQMHVCPKEPYKPFQCGHCSLSFAQPSELRNHVVVHSSERPYKCGFCGRSFAGATTLNNHVRTHTGERPFACKSCGKTFAIATQLARHTRVPGECAGHASSKVDSKYSSENLLGSD